MNGMLTRRALLQLAARTGIAAASAPLWSHELCSRAFAQTSGTYKAIVVITLEGGNDANNMLIPIDSTTYAEYASLRTSVAIPKSQCLPLSGVNFGLHPSLQNIASLYNSRNALIVANVGPLGQPVTKSQMLGNPSLMPEALLSHPAGVAQWESASTTSLATTGWGGRIADIMASQSGSLPPVLSLGLASIFTVGQSVQGIVVPQGGTAVFAALPSGIISAILEIAGNDSLSSNQLIAQAAQLRVQALNQQALLAHAQNSGTPLKTVFPTTNFGKNMLGVAQVINGRSVVGASRQIFYCQLGGFDTHGNQLSTHSSLLSELDGGIGAFITALQEMGLQNQVMLCTHSDFNRTFLANVSAGTDHAWGTHQLVLGGGIKGGQIFGTVPEPEFGGSSDLNGYGTWIPTLSVTQMVAGIGSWMGLSASQLATVFPDLPNFSQGALSFT
jgi:uncharacterized protein (DUF1501 family)